MRQGKSTARRRGAFGVARGRCLAAWPVPAGRSGRDAAEFSGTLPSPNSATGLGVDRHHFFFMLFRCHTLAAEAGHIDQALELAKSTEFDLAILDLNLRGEMVTPVAKLIMARGRPIIFATAYGSEGLPEDFRNFPALLKPYHLEDLAALIDQVGPRRALSP